MWHYVTRKPRCTSCYIALHAYVNQVLLPQNEYRLLHPSPAARRGCVRQAYAALYEWHASYKLSASAFDKVGAAKVLQTLRSFARKEGVEEHIIFGTEVVTVREQPDGRCVRRHFCNQVCQGLSPLIPSVVRAQVPTGVQRYDDREEERNYR